MGFHKASVMRRFTDSLTVISKTFQEGFQSLPFTLVEKAYAPSDLDGAWMVYACTENRELNARIKADAEQRHILCSVCDDPDLCDFVSPAIYKEGDISIAVTSNAKDVRRSIRMRNKIGEWLKTTHATNE